MTAFGHRLAPLVAALALAGCTSSAAPVAVSPASHAVGGRAQADTAPASLFVAQFKATTLTGYAMPDGKNHGPRCVLGGVKEVNGIGVDRAGTVWIPQQNNPSGSESILSFAPNCGPQGITLEDTSGYPFGIAFDSKETKYVMNIQDFGSKPGDVLVYPNGNTNPTASLSNAAMHLLTAVGVDRHDDVYVSSISSSQTGILVLFKKGHMPGKLLQRFTLHGIPGGTLLFDHAGNLLMDDIANVTLDIFAPPYDGPPHTIHLQGTSWQCALDRHERNLACADYARGSIDVYTYPGGTFEYSITKGLLEVDTVVGVGWDTSRP